MNNYEFDEKIKKLNDSEKWKDYEIFSVELAKSLRRIRRNNRISQQKLAGILHVSTQYISNLECGITKVPAYIVSAYCHLFNVSPNTLLNYEMDETTINAKILRNVEKMTLEHIQSINEITEIIAEADQNK